LRSQWNLQRLGETEDHLPARLCAARFHAAQMAGRDFCVERKILLADASNASTVAQQDAEGVSPGSASDENENARPFRDGRFEKALKLRLREAAQHQQCGAGEQDRQEQQ
jgi:hypothetical protein